jgi:hypothetical protein
MFSNRDHPLVTLVLLDHPHEESSSEEECQQGSEQACSPAAYDHAGIPGRVRGDRLSAVRFSGQQAERGVQQAEEKHRNGGETGNDVAGKFIEAHPGCSTPAEPCDSIQTSGSSNAFSSQHKPHFLGYRGRRKHPRRQVLKFSPAKFRLSTPGSVTALEAAIHQQPIGPPQSFYEDNPFYKKCGRDQIPITTA